MGSGAALSAPTTRGEQRAGDAACARSLPHAGLWLLRMLARPGQHHAVGLSSIPLLCGCNPPPLLQLLPGPLHPRQQLEEQPQDGHDPQLAQVGPATEHWLLRSQQAASPTVPASALSSRTPLALMGSTQPGLMAPARAPAWGPSRVEMQPRGELSRGELVLTRGFTRM